MRSKVALRSARRRALASSATSSAMTPASERRSSSVPDTSIQPSDVAGAIHEALVSGIESLAWSPGRRALAAASGGDRRNTVRAL